MTHAQIRTASQKVFKPRRSRPHRGTIFAAALVLALYAILGSLSSAARTGDAVASFMDLAGPLAIAAAGTAIILISGGFDLSVAGVISLVNTLSVTFLPTLENRLWLGVLIILAIGATVGAINGFIVAYVGIESLGATLATYIVLSGIALLVLASPQPGVPRDLIDAATAHHGVVSNSGVIIVVVIVLWLLFRRTLTGIAAFAIGNDRESTRIAGVNVRRVEMTCYVFAGILYAVAGLMLSALTASGDPNSGFPFLLTVFASMALGLISFSGGDGSVVAAICGALALTAITKVLFALGIGSYWTGVFSGIVILVALGIPLLSRTLRRAGGRGWESLSRQPEALAPEPGEGLHG